jgi:hypothetical protein
MRAWWVAGTGRVGGAGRCEAFRSASVSPRVLPRPQHRKSRWRWGARGSGGWRGGGGSSQSSPLDKPRRARTSTHPQKVQLAVAAEVVPDFTLLHPDVERGGCASALHKGVGGGERAGTPQVNRGCGATQSSLDGRERIPRHAHPHLGLCGTVEVLQEPIEAVTTLVLGGSDADAAGRQGTRWPHLGREREVGRRGAWV